MNWGFFCSTIWFDFAFSSKNNNSVKKYRGQAYNCALLMSGVYNGLETQIRCRVKLETLDAVKGVPEVGSFYDTLDCIFKFFSSSIRMCHLCIIFYPNFEILFKKIVSLFTHFFMAINVTNSIFLKTILR